MLEEMGEKTYADAENRTKKKCPAKDWKRAECSLSLAQNFTFPIPPLEPPLSSVVGTRKRNGTLGRRIAGLPAACVMGRQVLSVGLLQLLRAYTYTFTFSISLFPTLSSFSLFHRSQLLSLSSRFLA